MENREEIVDRWIKWVYHKTFIDIFKNSTNSISVENVIDGSYTLVCNGQDCTENMDGMQCNVSFLLQSNW